MPALNTRASKHFAKAPVKRRAADIAYDRIESLIARLEIAPGTPVVEADIAELTGLGRTPVREALMRMVSIGLVAQQPRRGLVVSSIDVSDHLDVVETRRVLERLIAASSARRATPEQRKALVAAAQKMIKAAEKDNLDAYMQADQELDHINHAACGNASAVGAVLPLVVQCRRFWYAYQHEGEIGEGARAHLAMAEAIASSDAAAAEQGAEQLMQYLARFTHRIINS